MHNWQNMIGNPWAMNSFGMGGFGIFALALVAWTLYWKYVALWKAAHREEKGWFVALLIINTLGILEILYVYVFSKEGETKKSE